MDPNEIIKQMLVSFIRKMLFSFGAYLVTRGWITQDLANTLLGDSFVWWVAGIVILALTAIWQYAKIRFNTKIVSEAIKSPSGTTPRELETEVLMKESIVTRL
jgi:hypothetical protein